MKNCFKQALAAVLVIACTVWAQTYQYIDASGATRTTSGTVTVISSNGGDRTLNTGWYLMSGTFTNNGTITVNGAVHIILENNSNVVVNGSSLNADAGINVSDGNSLSIYAQATDNSMGKLTATGGGMGAGIGGGEDGSGGTITIAGGKVTVTGGSAGENGGAGIGGGGSYRHIDDYYGAIHGGYGGNGGIITITGGIVTATGGGSCNAAGIGGGGASSSYDRRDDAIYGGNGGIITISGGTVMAKSGGLVEYNSRCYNNGGAGIGGGGSSSRTIDGNTIWMNGGSGGTITISGGMVTAEGNGGAGIGGSGTGNGGTIIISGGTVTATGDGGVGIGGGGSSCGKITINGGTVTATSWSGAGIGTDDDSNGCEITISGGTVTATGGTDGAGIGGSYGSSGGTITINGGTVTATGGESGAGIGGGYGAYGGGSGGIITISGGTVTATGGSNGGQGIGRGYGSKAEETFKLNGNAVVFANKIGDTDVSRRTSGILFIGNTGTFYGTSVTLGENVTIPASRTLAMPASATLTIPAGITLTNNGTVVKFGTINHDGVYGNWVGNPYIIPSSNIDLSENNPSPAGIGYTYANNIYTISDGAVVTVTGTSANQRRIAVTANATASITLNNAIISISNIYSPLLLNTGANVTLILEGENKLTAGSGYAGIQAPSNTTLTISGTGSLEAIGGSSGAGIGGGGSGSGGTITISGGVVTATGGSSAQGIGRGSSGTTAGTFTLDGNAVVFANSVGDTDESRRTGGILFIGNAGTFYGISVTLGENVTIPASRTLTIPANATLTIPAGITLTNNGIVTKLGIINHGGTYGNWAGNPYIIPSSNIDLSESNPSPIGIGYTYANNIYTISDGAVVTVTGTSANQRRIAVTANATASITLNNAIISISSSYSPLLLNTGARVTLILEGENKLTAGSNYAGIQAPSNTTLTISGTGSLEAIGGSAGAGIGSGSSGSGGTITISGGVVTATGGSSAQGIGRGSSGTTAGTFTLNGNAVVFANSVGDTEASRRTGGILFIGNAGTFYGTSVTLEGNVTIPTSRTLTIPANAILTIPEGITLTNNGTITPANGSTVIVAGTVMANKIIGANVSTPTLNGKTLTNITINALSLLATTGQVVEYAKNTTSTVPTSGWQTETTFDGLTENTTYYIFARSQANTNFANGTATNVQIKTKSIPSATNLNFAIPTNHIYNGEARGIGNVTAKTTGIGTITVLYNGSVTVPTNAGTYSVTADIEESNEFIAASGIVLGEYKITAKSVTITGLSASSKEYDGTETANIVGTAAVSGKVGSDVVNVTNGTASFSDKNIGTGKTVVFSGYSLSGTNASNYTLSAQPASVTANIIAKSVTIIGLTASNKEYDGNAAATVTGTATVNGLIGNDVITVANGTASFDNKNVGTGKTVVFSGYSLSGTNASNYTLSAQPASVTANITAKSVTITGLTASDKEYDGNATATITGTAVVKGKASSDVVNIVIGTASFDNASAGGFKIVTFSGFSLEGDDAYNYNLSAQPANVTANINAKLVTITGLTASNKEYDGNGRAIIVGNATVSGKIDGDIVTVANGTAFFADINVGNDKQVTFSGYSLSGADASNYRLSAQPASVTANITAKPVTITASVNNKVYDGDATATVETATINGKSNNDGVYVTNGTASFNDKEVGDNKPVTFNGFSLRGTDANNYTLSAQPASVTANITAKPLTITASANNKEYDGNATATVKTATINGKVGDDVVTVANGTALFADKNAGTNKAVTFSGFSLSGTDASNYTLSKQPANATANITAKPLTLTVTSITATNKVYDGTTTAEVHGEVSIDGKVEGDNLTIVKGNASFNNKNVGNNKPVTFAGFSLTGTDVSNYTVSVYEPISITANITAKPVTITATANDKVYDGNESATVKTSTINGKITGDAVTVVNGSATFSDEEIGNNKPVTFSGFSLSGTDAGNYTLSAQPASVTANITAQSTPTPPPIVVDKCGTSTINYEKQFCFEDKVYSKCNGSDYDPEMNKCQSGVLQYKCGKSSWYDEEKQFCFEDKVYSKCNGSDYDPEMNKCQGGVLQYKCGRNSWYNEEKQFCFEDIVYSLCGGSSYDPVYEICQSGEVIFNTTPILSQSVLGNISVQVINNDIMLSNLPHGAKVEVYNLQGKQIYSTHSGGSNNLRIGVQTKGMYIVKVGSQTMRITVR